MMAKGSAAVDNHAALHDPALMALRRIPPIPIKYSSSLRDLVTSMLQQHPQVGGAQRPRTLCFEGSGGEEGWKGSRGEEETSWGAEEEPGDDGLFLPLVQAACKEFSREPSMLSNPHPFSPLQNRPSVQEVLKKNYVRQYVTRYAQWMMEEAAPPAHGGNTEQPELGLEGLEERCCVGWSASRIPFFLGAHHLRLLYPSKVGLSHLPVPLLLYPTLHLPPFSRICHVSSASMASVWTCRPSTKAPAAGRAPQQARGRPPPTPPRNQQQQQATCSVTEGAGTGAPELAPGSEPQRPR